MRDDATTPAVDGAGESQADQQDQQTHQSDEQREQQPEQREGNQRDQRDEHGREQDDESEQPDAISADEARKLRSENRSLRRRLRESERQRDELREGSGDAVAELRQQLDDAVARANELQGRLREHMARGAVIDAADKAGAISGRAIWALLRDDLTYDDDGAPTGVEDAIEKLRKSDPDLFARTPLDGGARGGDTTAPGVDPIAAAYAANAASRNR